MWLTATTRGSSERSMHACQQQTYADVLTRITCGD